jgi:hypothetical protein
MPMSNQAMPRSAHERSNRGLQPFLANPLSYVLEHVLLSRGSRTGSRKLMTC